MSALREAHDHARENPSWPEPDPKDELARLADEFPGALRELDILPRDVIATRIEALELAERAGSGVPPWMRAQALFHAAMRGALTIKRWLRGRHDVSSATRAELAHATPALAHGADAALFLDDLERIANPPQGRLMLVVEEKVARTMGVTEAEVRRLVFGETRSARRT